MLVRNLEEVTLNAWPALQTVYYDGWVLSFAEGYTRRANSVHPLYPAALPVADKLAVCEAAYSARGQATIFKLSPLDLELDTLLDRRGYASEATSSVQVADLSRL